MREAQDHRAPSRPLYITPSERDALQLLADGSIGSELSAILGLDAREAESLLADLLVAMGAATQAEAIAIARARGLLKREPIPIAHEDAPNALLPS